MKKNPHEYLKKEQYCFVCKFRASSCLYYQVSVSGGRAGSKIGRCALVMIKSKQIFNLPLKGVLQLYMKENSTIGR